MNSNKRKYNTPGSSKRSPKRYKQSTRPAAPRLRVGETKGVDTLLTLNPVIATTNTNGSIFTLNLVPPGSASYNRVGRKIYNKSVRVKGVAKIYYSLETTTSDLTGNVLRCVLVWDKQPSGVLPAFDTIFGYSLQDGTEASQFMAPPRYDNMDRFQVLKDWTIHNGINATPPLAGTQNFVEQYFPFDEYIKLGNRETVFSGQTSPATIADVSTGALYMVFRSSFSTGTSNQVIIEPNSIARLRYTD